MKTTLFTIVVFGAMINAIFSQTVNFSGTFPGFMSNQPRPSNLSSDGVSELTSSATLRIGSFGNAVGTTFIPIDPTSLTSSYELYNNFVELARGEFHSWGNFSFSSQYGESSASNESLLAGETIYIFGYDFSDPLFHELFIVEYDSLFPEIGSISASQTLTIDSGIEPGDVLIGSVNRNYANNLPTADIISGSLIGFEAQAAPAGLYELQFHGSIVPEPSLTGLFTLGTTLLCLQRRKKQQ